MSDHAVRCDGGSVNGFGCASGLSPLRLALSDGITPPCLSTFLAKCRGDNPEAGIHLAEIPLSRFIELIDKHDVSCFGVVQRNATLESW